MNSSENRSNGIKITVPRIEDLSLMVELHIKTNPEAYLTSLGRRFLTGMYKRFIKDPRAVSFIARDELSANIAGVALGCVKVRSFYRTMGLHLAHYYVGSFISARLNGRNLGVGLAERYKHQSGVLPDEKNMAYFTQLNVSPDFQRRRVGSRLATQFYEEVKSRGADKVYLITNEDNASVRSLHEKMGCSMVKTYVTPSHIGRCLYVKNLGPEKSGQRR
ncbi:MAG TPA: GNAT family N-acetyltransferase [Desulfomonilaceae bacterium]|nr:GNAT family N-acetyltransferase [Desulfomonilaceae bacterium]